MKTEKNENLRNDKVSKRAEDLADLPITDEQAEQAKGGTDQLSVNFTKIQYRQIEYDS